MPGQRVLKPMEVITSSPFTFLVSLAAVVNGLGIVRLLTSLAEYVRRKHLLEVRHYWVFSLFMVLQLLTHVILWWSLWGIREGSAFNFLIYLYLLCGPTLLYLATSLLIPDLGEAVIDLRKAYFRIHRSYFSVMSLAWLWVILIWPLMNGTFAPTAPLMALLLTFAMVLRSTDNHRVHAVLAVSHWVMVLVYIGLFGMQLGSMAELMK